MRSSKEFRALARQRLVRKWGISVLVSFVAALLGSGGEFDFGFKRMLDQASPQFYGRVTSGQILPELHRLWMDPIFQSVFLGAVSISFMIGLGMLIIGGAVELGRDRYYLGLAGGETPEFGILFSRFHIFPKALGLRLYTMLLTLLWGLLFIIPGIVAAYRYAMAPYLMAQYPEKGIVECVEDSKALMLGHKGRLFLLHLSFIGWSILATLTAGLGDLWLNPYKQAAEAAFYLERTGQMADPYREGGWGE